MACDLPSPHCNLSFFHSLTCFCILSPPPHPPLDLPPTPYPINYYVCYVNSDLCTWGSAAGQQQLYGRCSDMEFHVAVQSLNSKIMYNGVQSLYPKIMYNGVQSLYSQIMYDGVQSLYIKIMYKALQQNNVQRCAKRKYTVAQAWVGCS